MRAALLQMTSSDNPAENLASMRDMLAEARAGGADIALTPEACNCISTSRSHQQRVLHHEADDPTLAGLRATAQHLGLWLVIGSLALRTSDADGRFANRSFLIGSDGTVRARYDKIHMFDVDVTPTETFRESEGFRPGRNAVVAPTPWAMLGLSVCYDVRFAHLYRALARAGAQILTVPAAFSPVTGAAHWEILLRARAIETGCFVLAPAQTGQHGARHGRARSTHGHSLAIAPWGQVLLDAGTEPGVHFADLDMAAVADARHKVPALAHDRPYEGP